MAATSTKHGVLQTWSPRTSVVRNLTPFGQDLRRIAEASVALAVDTHGCGWSDGACLVFAQALARWSDGELSIHAIITRTEREALFVDHAVCVWTAPCGVRLALDSLGLSTCDDLIARWVAIERAVCGGGRAGCTLEPFPLDGHELIEDPFTSKLLARSLERRFGEFDPWLMFSGALDRINEARADEAQNLPQPA